MSGRSMTKKWKPTGFRIPLVLSASIPPLGSSNISINPQMDFRGENIIVDPTVVGPNCTVTVPTVGTNPQIAGGTPTTGLPGTMFSPAQAGALDWTMDIANQGNAISLTAANTLTATTLAFAALLFGREVEEDFGPQTATAGVAHAAQYVMR